MHANSNTVTKWLLGLWLAFLGMGGHPMVAEEKSEEKSDGYKVGQTQSIFDGKTLEGWKSTGFTGHGEVYVEDGQLIIDLGFLTGVTWDRKMPFPKDQYEVSLEARRMDGNDFFCGMTFPIGEDGAGSLIVGGWGGGVVGLSCIDGQDASENETTSYKRFDKERWYRIRVRVTPEKVQAWIDDEVVVNVVRAGKKFSLRIGEIDLSMPFGFATYSTRGALRNIHLKTLVKEEVKAGKKDGALIPKTYELKVSPTQAPFNVPKGFEVQRVAEQPWVVNPVSVGADDRGVIYATETRRRKSSNLDIRLNRDWINDELSFRSVADKAAFYRRVLSPENSEANQKRVQDLNGDGLHDWRDLSVISERIHRLEDIDGDGVADKHTIFSEGFQGIVTGVAAGVMAFGDSVYATVAPDVWKMGDEDGDGVAERKEVLASGFGAHVAYAGHDMHGLVVGPDGRLYWSIGDVASDYAPEEGAVFRCELDGSGFEVFATGLRNPQELDFDNYGNWFTGDNDGDFGDRERWYHVVEGGDYGWRNYWQYQVGDGWSPPDNGYHVWNDEGYWHLAFPGQAAFLLPPAELIDAGPCGMAFYPGVGLGDEWADHFFLAHFTGSASQSGINAYRLEADGATYRLSKNEKWLRGMVATGLDFTADGSGLLVADWSGSWDLNEAGQVWRFYRSDKVNDAKTVETRRLLAEGLWDRSLEELRGLMGHENRNVRLRAQFLLAERFSVGGEAQIRAALKGTSPFWQRLHGVWAIWQVGRKQSEVAGLLMPLLKDSDVEIRGQAVRVLGDLRAEEAVSGIQGALASGSKRVRFLAAMALGKIGDGKAFSSVVKFLEGIEEGDAYSRFAGVVGLQGCGNAKALAALKSHDSSMVRMAAVVALRRMKRVEIQEFLKDEDPWIRLEAARGIHDVPLEGARVALADVLNLPLQQEDEALERRILVSNYRLGGADRLAAVLDYALDSRRLEETRIEALRLVRSWMTPHVRDRVHGAYLPISRAGADEAVLRKVVEGKVLQFLGDEERIRAEALKVAEAWGITIGNELFLSWLEDENKPEETRLAAFEALMRQGFSGEDELFRRVLSWNQGPFNLAVARWMIQRQNPSAGEVIQGLLKRQESGIRGAAIDLLGEWEAPFASRWLKGEGKKEFWEGDQGVRLNVWRAMERKGMADLLKGPWKSDSEGSGLERAVFLSSYGGDYQRGKKVFIEKVETQCFRCHQVGDADGRVGGNAAPALNGIGQRKDRAYLLESILEPNRTFAEGYERVTVVMKGGESWTGRILSEDSEWLRLEVSLEGEEETLLEEKLLAKTEVVDRRQELSGMPEGLGQVLSLEELRDLVEYLVRQ